MRFVEDNAVPVNLMQGRFLLDDLALAFEAALLLAEATVWGGKL